jgi:Uma2 family endonuclease
MTDLLTHPESIERPRTAHVADDPIDFQTWLSVGERLDTELINGVMLEKTAAQYPHELIFMWLASILRQFTGKRGLGTVLGSRTAVKISNHDGRLPDILFVRAENTAIIHQDAIYGAPDLVIEIVSPNDRPSDLIALETDYRILGIPEIVFVDPQKKQVRQVREREGTYEVGVSAEGILEFLSVPGFWIEIRWLFSGTPPVEYDVTSQLLQETEPQS